MRSLTVVISVAMLMACGCSGEDEDGPENLETLRVIGLWTETPELHLTDLLSGQVAGLSVHSIDFHPDDLAGRRVMRTYQWTVCFSLGALVKFACLDESRLL
jgi:hypothetical protein